MDEVFEHDEGPVMVVVDRGHLHDGGLLDRREAACPRQKSLFANGIGIAPELETHDLGGGFVERTPDLGALVAPMVGRKTIATGDELARLAAARDRSLRLRAVHWPDNAVTRRRHRIQAEQPSTPVLPATSNRKPLTTAASSGVS